MFLTLGAFRAQGTTKTVFYTASCKHAGYWSCAQALSRPAGNALPYELPCFLECDTGHPAHLSVERQRALPDLHSLMLQRAMAQPAKQRECRYYQHQSCFLSEVKGEQGSTYVLHRVHVCCTAHHSAEAPQLALNKSTKGHLPQQELQADSRPV